MIRKRLEFGVHLRNLFSVVSCLGQRRDLCSSLPAVVESTEAFRYVSYDDLNETIKIKKTDNFMFKMSFYVMSYYCSFPLGPFPSNPCKTYE